MEKTITGYLIDVENEIAHPVTIENSLHGFYDALGVNMIEMPRRRIGYRPGLTYVIVCDEEGLYKDSPKISAIDSYASPALVGNLLIVNEGEDGEVRSLSEADIRHISRYIIMQGTRKHPQPYPMLNYCEYA